VKVNQRRRLNEVLEGIIIRKALETRNFKCVKSKKVIEL